MGKSTEIIKEQRQQIVDQIIKDMESSGPAWVNEWLSYAGPRNLMTDAPYHGRNRIHLSYIARMHGYTDNRWCTFNALKAYNQSHDVQLRVRKGAHAARIENWGPIRRAPTPDDPPAAIEYDSRGRPYVEEAFILRGCWNVFNAADIEGPLPPEKTRAQLAPDSTISDVADHLIASSRCPIDESSKYQAEAYYSPSQDRICISPRETSIGTEAWVGTLAHEMIHSTGHRDALNRVTATTFGSPAYAEEELVAEIGSMFVTSDLGLPSTALGETVYDNHIAYLKSWEKALPTWKEEASTNPDYIFKAASKASKASEFILDRYEKELERQPEDKDVTLASGINEAQLAVAQGIPVTNSPEHPEQSR